MEDRLCNVKQVSEILNCGTNLAYKLIRTGVIPSLDFGGGYKVRYSTLLKFMETKEKRSS